MVQLVKNLQTALGERIRNLEWMGDSTKIKAIEKLNSFYVKVGYPDKWRDYTGLNIEKRFLLGQCEACYRIRTGLYVIQGRKAG